MNPDRWQQLQVLFEAALELEHAQRSSYLDAECGGDSDLRAQIDSLLRAATDDKDTLNHAVRFMPQPDGPLPQGERIGQYQVVRELGHGGMGYVYLASRADEVYLKQVAIKLIRWGLDRRSIEQRFRAERQILATLEHPNIARLLDGGALPDGSPYVVMEYVDGIPIDRYCRDRFIPIRGRLVLFQQLCGAVAYAHKHFVVHRDIKPANILVTPEGIPKLLDFGIAKLLGGDAVPAQSYAMTSAGDRLMTPDYASPEQVRGEPTTAATDVYLLGLLLYELLTSHRPFDFVDSRPSEVERTICETDPAKPSRSAAGAAPRELKGDLDTIVMKALRKEPERRYLSVEAMSEDIRRHLEGFPILAADDHFVYRSRKFLWRHRVGAAICASVVFACGGGIALLFALGMGPGRNVPARELPLFEYRAANEGSGDSYPVLAPKGDRYVFVRRVAGFQHLFASHVGPGAPIDLTPNSHEENGDPALSPDGAQLAFRSERDGGGIFMMSSSGGIPRKIATFGHNPSWSPDGRLIACATQDATHAEQRRDEGGAIWVLDLSSGSKRLVFKTFDAVQPVWSPSGQRLAFWSLGRGSIRSLWTIQADGSDPRPIANPADDWNPVWDRSGRALYFLSKRGGNANLWRISIDQASGVTSGQPQPETTPSMDMAAFCFSRDGRRMVYERRVTKGDVLASDVSPHTAHREPRVIVHMETGNRPVGPDLSRDEKWIAFYTVGTQEDILIVGTDGAGQRQLTDDRFKDRAPRWSPGGHTIVFLSNRSGRRELWSIRPDGSGLRQLTKTTGPEITQHCWAPDGKYLAYYDGTGGSKLVPVSDAENAPVLGDPVPLPPTSAGNFLVRSYSEDGASLLGYIGSSESAAPLFGTFNLQSRQYRTLVHGRNPTFAPDGFHVLLDRSSLYLLDLKTLQERLLLKAGSESWNGERISADLRTLYYSTALVESSIWIRNEQ